MYANARKTEKTTHTVKGFPGAQETSYDQIITVRLANPSNPGGASIEVQYFWQHDGGASAETVTSWGMIEKQLTDIETKPGRVPYIEWKDGGKSDVEKRVSGFAYLIFTDFAIVPIEMAGEAKVHDETLKHKA